MNYYAKHNHCIQWIIYCYIVRLLMLCGVKFLTCLASSDCLKFSAFMSYAVRGRNTTISCLMTLKDP